MQVRNTMIDLTANVCLLVIQIDIYHCHYVVRSK